MHEIPIHHLLWAKLGEDGRYHPLICHLMDVGEVAQALWNAVLTDGIRSQFTALLGAPAQQCGSLLSLWVGLHDLGKASPAFQRRDKGAVERLTAAGLTFPRVFVRSPCPHGTISATVLGTLLQEETGLKDPLSRLVARTLGGHHGTWPLPADLQRVTSRETGAEEWAALRRELFVEMMGLFPPPPVDKELTRLEVNTLVMLLSGLCVVADWVGSMEQYFPFADNLASAAEYAERATSQAQRALRELGWVGWSPPTKGLSFEDLCDVDQPRPMQEAVIALAGDLAEPSLVIIEAPTGVGKTEAALYLADHWAVTCQQRGLYVAMPTMATSNQMFTRVRDVLVRRYPNSLVNLHLVHSQARWREDVRTLRLETTDELDDGAAVAAMSWFLPRKRTLLASFGVGTVDQALLSVLQTRHFFLRLFGLSHKTVIFDEVHAYDTYMSIIFQRLLGWLRLLGASVVILSATLPRRTRQELVEAYLGTAASLADKGRYPSLIWAMGDKSGLVPLEGGEQRRVALEWVDREPEAIARLLRSELSEGGCAAVICNTVARSQELYGTLREAAVVEGDELYLFHARFPLAWRHEIEERVLADFGRDGRRPAKAVVVATQVIEQSLDLDFDLMISDLAPADLLIQRAGRLHRHRRQARPARCSEPRLIIGRPEGARGAPDFGADAHVYERYVLLRSYLALQGRDRLTLPDDTQPLIETVYGEEELPASVLTPELEAELARALEELTRHEQKDAFEARSRLVPACDADSLLDERSLGLEEDNPDLHRAFQALTRLAPPGTSLVCLHRTRQGLALEHDGSGPVIELEEKPDEQVTRALAQHAIKVTNWPVVEHFLARRPPSAWKDSPALRFHRLAIFDRGVCALEGTSYVLRLTRDLGLEIDKEGGVDEDHV